MLKFRLNKEGVHQLLVSKEMREALNTYADQAYRKLGAGYELEEGETEQRAKVRIKAATKAAQKENLDNNTLLKAIGK